MTTSFWIALLVAGVLLGFAIGFCVGGLMATGVSYKEDDYGDDDMGGN